MIEMIEDATVIEWAATMIATLALALVTQFVRRVGRLERRVDQVTDAKVSRDELAEHLEGLRQTNEHTATRIGELATALQSLPLQFLEVARAVNPHPQPTGAAISAPANDNSG